MSTFREAQRAAQWQKMQAAWTEIGLDNLGHSVLVFAPHADDETLGCGGTIARLRAAGSRVRIIVMTDGSQSHGHLMPADDLVALRRTEALEAAALLGVAAEDVLFLDYPDQELGRYREGVIDDVKVLLEKTNPQSCFVPYHGDDHTDHKATNRIVRTAVHQLGHASEIYGYPIWFWMRWPWVPIWEGWSRRTLRGIRNTYFAFDGFHPWRDFDHAVSIAGLQAQKHAALAAHSTQMVAPDGNPQWPTLPGVGRGHFLTCFFQSHEVFHRYDLKRKRR